MEHITFDKFTLKTTAVVAISNEEFLSAAENTELPLISFLHEMFKLLEQQDVVVVTILMNPEMEQKFQKFGPAFYEARHLWTAHVRIIDDLQDVIFLGDGGDLMILEVEKKTK